MRTVKSAAVTIVVLAILAGCGPMPETTPTATAVPPTIEPGEDIATPPSGTPAVGPVTFGDLADRVGAAWQSVQSYRVTFTGTALSNSAGAGTPVARTVATPGATPVA